MLDRTLRTLEYTKIIEQLTQKTHTPFGKTRAEALIPSIDLYTINHSLNETDEAVQKLYRSGSIPFRGMKNVTGSLNRLQIMAILNPGELLDISYFLDGCRGIKQYGSADGTELSNYKILGEYFNAIEPLVQLTKEIQRCIESEDNIADDASPELRDIRRGIKNSHDKIKQSLNKFISGSGSKNMLQENLITMRNNRYCLPVKAEYRGAFPGMIHDQSASGSTLFIEPASIVSLNNEIKELEMKETKEIEVILSQLSNLTYSHILAIEGNIESIAAIDFAFAKGQLSLDYKASKPIFNTQRHIHIKKGRHPLLDPKTVVPIDVYLGKDFTTLMITGPNTGGKTVTLKTIGLLTLMGQSGLFIPAFDGSQLALFSEVYADIGDEQSIAQSLSTFSSHMKNIISIINEAPTDSLVLFDEIGSGTDPVEGAALAMAILEFLRKLGILTAATTHYSELKVYALSTPGVRNASCEFDIETLRPTFKLLIGIPGKSNAFAISEKLGLPHHIIEDAKVHLQHHEVRFEDLITDLEINKKTALLEKERAEQLKREADLLMTKLEEQQQKFEFQRQKMIDDAKSEAMKVLAEAKNEADQIIRDMNRLIDNGQVSMKELELNRSKLRELSQKATNKQQAQQETVKKPAPKSVQMGDTVHLPKFNGNGIVVALPDSKGSLTVQLGIMKMRVHLSDIDAIINEAAPIKSKNAYNGTSKIGFSKAQTIKTELDLRGQNASDALMAVEKYLDDAYLSKIPQVTIIHGKGTGILRTEIHQFLRKVQYVDSYRLGNYGEGESGVTIVLFK